MRIIVEVPDLEPGRTKSQAIARYVRAALKVQALRHEFAEALGQMRVCKQAIYSRARAEDLLAEAYTLCEELNIEPTNR